MHLDAQNRQLRIKTVMRIPETLTGHLLAPGKAINVMNLPKKILVE